MRYLGLLPLAFFAVAAVYNVQAGAACTLLWVCNVANVLLGVALLAAWSRGVAVATLSLLAGTPLWLLDVALGARLLPYSFFTHVVAGAIGVYAMVRLPRTRGAWWQAVVFGLILQLVARLTTPPAENVNVAFTAYRSLQQIMPSFFVAWVANVAAYALGLFVLERVLVRAGAFRR